MKIQYASDLHIEMPLNAAYMERYPLKPVADTLILAGDVTYLNRHHLNSKILTQISNGFKEVFIIPGNHEFYAKYFAIEGILSGFKKQVRDNMWYLNNQTVFIDDVRILFTTLFSLIGDDESSLIKRNINDFHGTRFYEDSMLSLSINEFNYCHKICLGYLLLELEKPFYGKTVVVSHFSPFNKQWIRDYPKFSVDLSSFFHVDLEWMCEKYSIDHWISGHTHINFDSFKIGNTWMHSNMLGYIQNAENEQFNNSAVIQV